MWDIETEVKQGEVWAIAGDWNDICSNEEKRGGRQRSASSFSEFNAFIAHMGMQELHQCGSFFTWGNNRDGERYIEERLDKIFVSLGWMQQLPGTRASNLFRSSSDHNVLFMETSEQSTEQKGRFIFNSEWTIKDGVSEAVLTGWQSQCEGTPMFRVKEKIKYTRMALLNWQKPPRIRISGLEVNLKVKDLLSNGGTTWDQTLVKALFEEEDAAKIMLIDTLNPALPDRISCKFAVKGL
ncbi:glutamate--tRNA ligase 2 [Striga asiatica]|uniref:Glutamate--tRNA ligase 2 n=1 Tax=Striga asiatica TaxID=4170 RepID=A0A5A7PBZ2_STRAF|nr:glutamate--tRNA ligase 2 [Striga asiatica]